MINNPYTYPILFAGTLEVLAFMAVKAMWPKDDNTVLMGAITLALGQVVTFLVNSAQAELATKRADIATERADAATDGVRAAKQQVQAVSDQVTQVNDKSDEALITSRTGLGALVKSDDLVEFDALVDGFSHGTLTEDQTERFVELLELRKMDDLTIAQLSAAHRILEIAHKELNDPAIAQKPFVPQSVESVALSKEIQAGEEVKQKVAGTRKENTTNALAGAGSPAPDPLLTMPSVVEAAKAAADSAEETKTLAENVVVEAVKEIEKAREEKKES